MSNAEQDGEVEKSNKIQERKPTTWEEMIPWFMTIISVVVLVSLAWFLLDNIYWFRKISTLPPAPTASSYRIYVYQMHLASINRSVGLFAGFALIFIGTSVSFFTLKKYTHIQGSAGSATAKLSTASPGIVAIVLGTALIMFTIGSKNQFPAPSLDSDSTTDVRPQQGEPPFQK